MIDEAFIVPSALYLCLIDASRVDTIAPLLHVIEQLKQERTVTFSYPTQSLTFSYPMQSIYRLRRGICIGSSSAVQLQQVKQQLVEKHKFNLVFSAHVPTYRATIAAPLTLDQRFVRPSPGSEQFAIIKVRIEPSADAGRIRFTSNVEAETIYPDFQKAVLRAVGDTLICEGVDGIPVVNVAITLLDGVEHPVDSRQSSFYIAGCLAMREALRQAEIILIEPHKSPI